MSLSHRNQSIDLLCKLMDWFLNDRDLRYERVNRYRISSDNHQAFLIPFNSNYLLTLYLILRGNWGNIFVHPKITILPRLLEKTFY